VVNRYNKLRPALTTCRDGLKWEELRSKEAWRVKEAAFAESQGADEDEGKIIQAGYFRVQATVLA
jgi:hypothetical protein